MPRIKVGINMPWWVHGRDFGYRGEPGKPPVREPDWRNVVGSELRVDADLRLFKSAGIFAVRWFILADGEFCGLPTSKNLATGKWEVNFKALPGGTLAAIKDDFAFLLDACKRNQLLLVPSLINHQFCFDGVPTTWGTVKCGRAEAIADPANRKDFLDSFLKPLVQMSESLSTTSDSLIYAWELISEPEMCTYPDKGAPTKEKNVEKKNMMSFIKDGCKIINEAGFRSTVGFQKYYSPRLGDAPPGEKPDDWNWDSAGLGITLHQFHYYADTGNKDPIPLPRNDWTSEGFPCVVGEIATAPHNPWGGMNGCQTVRARLEKLEDLGYPAAFLWASKATADPTVDWSATSQQDAFDYTHDTSRP